MLEDRPVTMPANSGARIVADQQRLYEVIRLEAGEPRRLLTQGQQPIRDRIGPAEGCCLEVVAPAKRGGQALSGPSVKTEGRQRLRVDGPDERLFLARGDKGFGLRQAWKTRSLEQIRLRRRHARFSQIDPRAQGDPPTWPTRPICERGPGVLIALVRRCSVP